MKLTRKSPVSLGIRPSAILNMVRQWDKNGGLHSFMVIRHRAVAAEGWWAPYSPNKTHMLYSLSKSFTSIAVAFAAYEDLLDFDAAVISYFPEYERLPEIDSMVRSVKIKHLLTMSTGHNPNADFIFNYIDPIAAFFCSKTDCEPGTRFGYNTGATYMISAAIQKVTGIKLIDYLKPRLFEPLGIEDITWDECALGVNLGGTGLNVKTEDIAKFGLFLLNRGKWDARQLIPAGYIDRATEKHINNWTETKYPQLDKFKCEELPESDWARGYGYQFWRCVPDDVYRGDGAYGQLCVIMPRLDTVIACTAGLGDMQQELRVIWNNLNDDAFFDGVCDDESEIAAQKELEELTGGLSLPEPNGDDFDSVRRYSGNTYQLGSDKTDSVKILFEHDRGTIIFNKNGYSVPVCAGYNCRLDNKPKNPGSFFGNPGDKCECFSASMAASGDTLTVAVVYTLTPYSATFTLTFDGPRLFMKVNCHPGAAREDYTGYLTVKAARD
ncbi:MAG: serine hydrolase [Eubacteriales bacterium]|nr:serine hydrolase [Eubacteriales bacterium]